MTGISTLGLSTRLEKVLTANGIDEVEGLTALHARDLLSLAGFGSGSLTEVQSALGGSGLSLAIDPYASYVCARHGEAAMDAGLANLFLCDDCAEMWQAEAFADEPPAYVGAAIDGYCLNCNVQRDDVRLRQWFLCGTCERVARSIGRSVVAERYITEQWEAQVAPHAPGLDLVSTDVPTLRRRERDVVKRAEIDFVASRADATSAFGFELKTGKSHLSGVAQVGPRMGQFQLDTTDCDDITTVMDREDIPVYLLHGQVIDRAFPPTVQYVALGAWWTDVFRMHGYFHQIQRRPRETRDAAYFDTDMFESFASFGEHVAGGGPDAIAERLRNEGIPTLYER